MKPAIRIVALFAIALAAPVFGQRPPADHSAHHAGAQSKAVASTEGEVRKVDKAAKKITIKHGPIVNLDMPAMTMVFQVKDAKMLGQVKAGDKIKFSAENIGGALTVTAIEPSK
jgi:Cu(I)/Ag(I) efflux system protein CusF